MDVHQSLSQPRDEIRHELYAASSNTIWPAKRLRDYRSDESTPKRLCSSPDDSASGPLTPRVFSPILEAQVSPPEDDVVMWENTYRNYGGESAAEVAVSMEGMENALVTTENIGQKICYGAVKTIVSPHLLVIWWLS